MTLLPPANLNKTLKEFKEGRISRTRVEHRAKQSGWKILGKGLNGLVFNNGKLVRKFATSNNRSEFNTMKKLTNNGANYIPKVHALKTGPGYSIYSMNRLPPETVTLHTFLYNRPWLTGTARKMLRDIVEDMHERGVSHGDLHDNNIMVTVSSDWTTIKKMWIIDFGRTIKIKHGKTELQSYKGLGITKTNSQGTLWGPSVRYSRPNLKVIDRLPLYNFKRGLTTLNKQGRKVYVGPRGGLFRIESNKKVPVKSGPKVSRAVAGNTNTKGRLIHKGPRGGLYVIVNGKKIYK